MTDAALFALDDPRPSSEAAAERAERLRRLDADMAAFRRQWYPTTTPEQWAAWHAGTGARPLLVRPERAEPPRQYNGVLVEHHEGYTVVTTTMLGKTTVTRYLLTANTESNEQVEKAA